MLDCFPPIFNTIWQNTWCILRSLISFPYGSPKPLSQSVFIIESPSFSQFQSELTSFQVFGREHSHVYLLTMTIWQTADKLYYNSENVALARSRVGTKNFLKSAISCIHTQIFVSGLLVSSTHTRPLQSHHWIHSSCQQYWSAQAT